MEYESTVGRVPGESHIRVKDFRKRCKYIVIQLKDRLGNAMGIYCCSSITHKVTAPVDLLGEGYHCVIGVVGRLFSRLERSNAVGSRPRTVWKETPPFLGPWERNEGNEQTRALFWRLVHFCRLRMARPLEAHSSSTPAFHAGDHSGPRE